MLKESFRYDAFGQVTFQNSTAANFYGYNGESTNSSTGLQYLRSRYYDPSQGRFLSEDSWLGQQTNRLSRNRYLYVENNPLNYTDPSGLAKTSVSKAAQLKARQELAKKAAGKTNGLDGYQQNILARQKQQEAAAKRKKAQQELAKKELKKSQVHIPTGIDSSVNIASEA